MISTPIDREAAYTEPAGLLHLSSHGKMLPFPHIQVMSDKLRQVTLGESKRLICCMPPQHGKSEQTSRCFPAWHLGHKPDDKVVCASYGDSLARKSGFANRQILREYGESLFGIKLRDDDQSVMDWGIQGRRGGLRCVGVGSGLTGHPADLIIIDDPFKGFEDAISQRGRERVWDWFTSVAMTRLSKRGRVVIIQTRWHKDDLVGRLLKNEPEDWDLVSMPAISDAEGNPADDGFALCPQLHPLEKLKRDRKTQGLYNWSCLYQQTPIDSGRFYFPEKYFDDIFVDEFPPQIKLCTAAHDPASGKKTGKHDYPAFVMVATADYKTYFVDAFMEKHAFSELRPKLIDFISTSRRPQPSVITIEVDSKQYGNHGTDFRNFDGARVFNTMLDKAGLQTRCMIHTSKINKQVRIKSLGDLLSQGCIKFVRSPGSVEVVSQLQQFGMDNVHDDGPDCLEMALRPMALLIRKMAQGVR